MNLLVCDEKRPPAKSKAVRRRQKKKRGHYNLRKERQPVMITGWHIGFYEGLNADSAVLQLLMIALS
jgi:hypothetical protein